MASPASNPSAVAAATNEHPQFTENAANGRVLVAGIGAVTALGNTADELWSGARSGRVAIEVVQGIDMRGFGTKLGGQVSDLAVGGGTDGEPFRERALELAQLAAHDAVAGLPAAIPAERRGLVLGTCNAGLLSAREWFRRGDAGEPVDPSLLALVTPGGIADALAATLNFAGPVLAVNTACASGANAIGLAADLIRQDRADVVLAGGTDALSDIVFAGFSALEALSPLPAAPYSGNRQGLSLGEGSGMVLLVSARVAREHGLPVLAEVVGYGLSADGYHPTAPRPDGSGAARAMTAAMTAAGVSADAVGYVNGHGTGTPKNDSAESNAIATALGDAADTVAVSSTKSVIGHLLGAAGAVEAIVTMMALAEQVAPPTAGYLRPDPECPLDYVPNHRVALSTNVALSNNFAFGGANACLALARPHAVPVPRPAPPADVVISGLAVLSPDGDCVDDVMQAYADRRDGYAPLDVARPTRIEIDPDAYLDRRARRRLDRLSVLSVIATARALEAAGLAPGSAEAGDCGVLFGTGVGPMEAIERFSRPLLNPDRPPADPAVFPNTVYNQAAGQIAMHLGLYGPTSTLSMGHATGLATIGYAADLIRSGRARRVVATVTDALTPAVAAAYHATGLAGPDGSGGAGRFALTEGSVALVLESRKAAAERGATAMGDVLGWGLAGNGRAAGRWGRDGEALERAIRAALHSAGLQPGDIGDIWRAAAGHRLTDVGENRALNRVFGPPGRQQRWHSARALLGEAGGVGGSLSTALAVHAFTDRGWPARPALVNSSSLTGSHSCLVIAPAAASSLPAAVAA